MNPLGNFRSQPSGGIRLRYQRRKKDDREAARTFLVRKLELDRNAELDRLSAEIFQARKIEALQYEIELTRLNDDEETKKWRNR